MSVAAEARVHQLSMSLHAVVHLRFCCCWVCEGEPYACWIPGHWMWMHGTRGCPQQFFQWLLGEPVLWLVAADVVSGRSDLAGRAFARGTLLTPFPLPISKHL